MEEEFFSIEDESGWSSVFQRLHHTARAQAGTQLDGKKPANLTRNRYRDVIPIDAYRVKLNDADNDYINASYVESEDVKRKYILCQGPLQHTCHHYWQMIWEQKTAGIIMLNKCIERGSNKCYQYWPCTLNDPIIEFASFRIELVSIEDMQSYRMSTLRLENMESDEEARTILHFHYTRWPDFGVPRTPDDFLDFLYSVRRTGVLNSDVGPSVVHCSAGIGRSGTFCLIDICLKKIELTSDLSIELQPILLEMRKQRLGLVQTADQLRFCYIAILQASIPEEDELEESNSEEEEESEGVAKVQNGFSESTSSIGTNIYKDQHFDDLPPPIPPRYPDMIEANRSPSPPPPPPPTLPPPGPPEYENEDDQDSEEEEEKEKDVEEILGKQDSLEDPHDVLPWYLNGGMANPDEDSNPEKPPSPPPRVESVYREKESPSHADHFLALGRGGENKTSPLPLPTQQDPPTQQTLPTQQTPPLQPKPAGETPRVMDFNEEEALINELNELEKLVSQYPKEQTNTTNNQEPGDDEMALKAKELRKQERLERQQRLNEKVALMKNKISQENTKEWSTSWVVIGAVAIASYCAYYFLS